MQYKIPSLLDLQKNPDDALEFDEFLKFVHQPTPAQFVLLNKFNKNKPYLPIDKVKWMLTMIFRQWHVDIRFCEMQANSMVCIVRLHYLMPSGEWKYQDGVGAASLQTDSGAAASALTAIKNNAVQLAAPMAESFAIKDAADKIGPIFGDSLKELLPFEPFKAEPVEQPQPLVVPPTASQYPGYMWNGQQWIPDPSFQQPMLQPNQTVYPQQPIQPQTFNF